MNNEKKRVSDARVDLPLDEYLEMRDTISRLLETTKTHQEFIKQFRTSLVSIITKASVLGFELNPMLEYYTNLDFKPIQKLDFIEVTNPMDNQKRYVLVIKVEEDEKGFSTIIK